MAIDLTAAPRKGATRVADIPPAILRRLNAGEIASATLVESLALDFRVLMKRVLPGVNPAALRPLEPANGITKRMNSAGRILFHARGAAAFGTFATHPSDTVRGWAAYTLALTPKMSLGAKLCAMRPLADDPHSGVREWAWLALRPEIAESLEEALAELIGWTGEASPFLRRFAVEATRPRGVWCDHIAALKQDPELGLALLEPLRADPEKYVQDSVSNWLNDAAKSKPEWVEQLCARWYAESRTAATVRIVKRAMRSL